MSRIKKFKWGNTVYDVGPNKTSELQNDAGFLTEDDAAVNVTQDTNGDIKISGLAAAHLDKPKWELIRDITLTEETNTFIVDEDENGDPFELGSISYVINVPRTERESAVVDIIVHCHSIKSPITKIERRIGYHNNGIYTTTRCCSALCVVDSNTIFAIHATQDAFGNNTQSYVLTNNLCNTLLDKEYVIDAIKTRQELTAPFPIGTTIKIYGKRA